MIFSAKLLGSEVLSSETQNFIKAKLNQFFGAYDLVLGFVRLDEIKRERHYIAQIFYKGTHLKLSEKIEFSYNASLNLITLDYFYPSPADGYFHKGHGGAILMGMFSKFEGSDLFVPYMREDFRTLAREKLKIIKLEVKETAGFGRIPLIDQQYKDLMPVEIIKIQPGGDLSNLRVIGRLKP